MTIDLSVVKRIAQEVWGENIGVGDGVTAPVAVAEGWCDIKLTRQTIAFAQAIYAMGAAEQKEKDAKICEQLVTFPAGHNGQWEGYGNVTKYRDGKGCAEAIRSQE